MCLAFECSFRVGPVINLGISKGKRSVYGYYVVFWLGWLKDTAFVDWRGHPRATFNEKRRSNVEVLDIVTDPSVLVIGWHFDMNYT